MTQEVDARLIELLCARLCHDLVGPVSAIGNGMELVTEFGEEMRGEALALIAQSASEAARRLQFFRVAFGSAAGADGRSIPIAEARARAIALPLGGKVRLEWPEVAAGGEPEFSRAAVKLLLNLILVAVDAVSGSGTVRVQLSPPGGSDLFAIVVEGPRANLGDDMTRSLAGSMEAANSPRTAVALLAHVLAEEAGAVLGTAEEPGRVSFTVRRAA